MNTQSPQVCDNKNWLHFFKAVHSLFWDVGLKLNPCQDDWC